MTMFATKAAVCLALIALPSAASAARPDATRVFSLTHSPTHLLLFSTMEVTGEYRLARKHGLAAIAGLGYPGVLLAEAGASYRAYPLGDFDRGMQLGAEILWAGATNSYDSATALQTSLMAGGKFTFDFGLTMEGQLGPTWIGGEIGPMLNLNIGWSFGEKR